MTKVLTKRKAAWSNKFRPDVLRGDPLNPNAAVEARYYDTLRKFIDAMTAEVEKELAALFRTPHAEEYFAEDKSIAAQARIVTNALMRKFDALFASIAPRVAGAMMNKSNAASSKSMHSSIQKLSGGLSLPTASLSGQMSDKLKAGISENVSLIKSIPQKYLQGVQGAVMRSITTGNGLQDLVPYLARNKGVTLRRARFIAMDQTRKAFNSLNAARMENLAIDDYEWLHTGGSNHPRKEHIAMSGKLYKLSKPPIIDSRTGERGIPGQLPGCRCRMVPVIKFGNK